MGPDRIEDARGASNDTPFGNPDPFDTNDQGHQLSTSESKETDEKSEGRNGIAFKDDVETIGKDSDDDVTQHDDPTVLGKIRTKAEDVAPGMMDRLKTTAHRFHLDSMTATGISRALNPTAVHMRVRHRHEADETEGGHGEELALIWRSRDNRKGRNSIAIPLSKAPKEPSSPDQQHERLPEPISSSRDVGRNLLRMFTTFPYWDMAFWSGWSYTVGSALFVIDGAWAWSIIAYPGSEFAGEDKYGVPLVFFFGACFYQIGGVLAYLEAVNDGSFHGSAMRRLLEGHDRDTKRMLDDKIHAAFGHLVPHRNRKDDEEHNAAGGAGQVDPEAGWATKHRRSLRPGSIYPSDKRPAPRRGGVDLGEAEEGTSTTYMTWRWWPSWQALRTHHVYEIGYLACAIQLFGVTLYGVTSIIILPGILDTFTNVEILGGYWVLQMVASACFLIASIMFMFETQEKWWKPEPRVLGWWIGFWSIVGSVGFELCAAFGPTSDTQDWAAYQSNLSSTWGSFAYLIGSFLQWYEAINKRPFEELLTEPGAMKSFQIHAI